MTFPGFSFIQFETPDVPEIDSGISGGGNVIFRWDLLHIHLTTPTKSYFEMFEFTVRSKPGT